MNPSERIQQLCQEALANPEISRTESFEKKVEVAPAPVGAVAVAVDSPPDDELVQIRKPVAAAGKPPVEPSVEPSSEAVAEEGDEALRDMLAERDERQRKKLKLARLGTTALVAALLIAPVAVVGLTPSLRAKAGEMVGHLRKGADDIKMLGGTKETYDEALDQVAVRSDQIDEASRALGVDPDSVDPGDDPNMTAEMTELVGEDEAATIGARGGRLENLGKLARGLRGESEE